MAPIPPAEPFARIEDAQHFLEQGVYDHFRTTGEWPRARDFDLAYYTVLDPLGGLEIVCRDIGTGRLTCGSVTSESDRIVLRLPALAGCARAEDDIRNFIAAAGVAGDRYHKVRGTDAQLTVADLVEELKIDDAAARRALALLYADGSITGGGGGDQVRLTHGASRMRGVATLDDYMKRSADTEARRFAAAQRSAGLLGQPKPLARPPKKIFLSHAADDAAVALHLRDVFRQGAEQPLEVFVASKAGDIPTGADWLEVIEKELRRAEAYVVLLTPRSIERRWLWYETGAAWMNQRPLVPLTAAGLAKGDVPYPLGARQALSLEVLADVEQLARDLGVTIPDPGALCDTVRDLSKALPYAAATAFQGVSVGDKFFDWGGPLHKLEDFDPIANPPGVLEALRVAGAEPSFVHHLNVRALLANGFVKVFATDRLTWKRELLEPGNGNNILTVRPPGAAPTFGELHLEALKRRITPDADLDAYAYAPTEMICVQNPAPTDARGVTLTVLDRKEPFLDSPPFPLAILRGGETFRHPGSFVKGSIPFEARLNWTDAGGTSRERTLTVKLRRD